MRRRRPPARRRTSNRDGPQEGRRQRQERPRQRRPAARREGRRRPARPGRLDHRPPARHDVPVGNGNRPRAGLHGVCDRDRPRQVRERQERQEADPRDFGRRDRRRCLPRDGRRISVDGEEGRQGRARQVVCICAEPLHREARNREARKPRSPQPRSPQPNRPRRPKPRTTTAGDHRRGDGPARTASEENQQ